MAVTMHDGLAVYEHGAGDTVLVMPGPHRFQRPGLPAADALLDGVRALGRRAVTFDPPGSGASTRPAQLGMPEMHRCADEALAVCNPAGPVDVLGHSMGGLVALAYAIDRPERVRRLVLVGAGSGGPAYMRAPGALWNRSHPDFTVLAALGILQLIVRTRGPERVLRNYIERRSFADPRHAEPVHVGVRDWFGRRQGRTDWHGVARRLDYRPHLRDIRARTLVLCGRRDPQFPPACSEELATGIDDASLVWFDNSGHYPFIEEPTAFWGTVQRFLDDQ